MHTENTHNYKKNHSKTECATLVLSSLPLSLSANYHHFFAKFLFDLSTEQQDAQHLSFLKSLHLYNFKVRSTQTFCSLGMPLVLYFYQYSGDTASHYAAQTTLALSLLVTDRPAIVSELCSALTLNSLAGRLPASVSSRDTRRLSSHEAPWKLSLPIAQHIQLVKSTKRAPV